MTTDDGVLADRIRALLADRPDYTEQRMFGGIGFLLAGNMVVGLHQHQLVARLGPEQGTAALAEPHVRPFDVTGRPMAGWVFIDPAGCATDEALQRWVDLSVAFVATLPPKAAGVGSGGMRRPAGRRARTITPA